MTKPMSKHEITAPANWDRRGPPGWTYHSPALPELLSWGPASQLRATSCNAPKRSASSISRQRWRPTSSP